MTQHADDSAVLSVADGWETVQATTHGARGALYAAGSTAITLLWAGILSVGYLAQWAVAALSPGFADDYPWYPGPLWAAVAVPGIIASAVIGHRAGLALSPGRTMREAGLRVFAYWMTVTAAAVLLPGAAGLWNQAESEKIPFVLFGVFALGYALFGILNRPVIAVFGFAVAVAFYVPHYLFDDAAPAVSGLATLALLGATWLAVRRKWQW